MLKNIVSELKNTVEGFNSRLDKAEEWVNKTEDKAMELTQTKHKKEKKKVESTLGDLQDNIKQNNICIIEFTRRGKERGRKFI